MLDSHKKFHSENGKRLILVADDEFINREILAEILRHDYETVFACDGEETMAKMRELRDSLSLVLLDILMPGLSGLDILRLAKADDTLSHIPVIVTTTEREAEVESLKLGAIDFIPKPYPAADVILARIYRTIELSEDRDIIMSTERDPLTGLYNRDYFYRYAEQFDHFHKDMHMDAVILDINHFRMINERYGKAYGDTILRQIGRHIGDFVAEKDGIVCRLEADTFMIYCIHREDYAKLMEETSLRLLDSELSGNRVRLRMGIYSDVDKDIDIERRFGRAKMAADTVKGSLSRPIGVYDSGMHEKELFAEQLIEAFPAAIAENQFKVYFQPKFDIRQETPFLASAEALVRWIHPDLGMISPGEFIPLFEANGLIQKLDEYVWRETAAQIRDWKERLGYSIPVSVNVSRIDMYDPGLARELQSVLDEYGLTGRDMLLEVTESAYTQDSEQIIKMGQELRALGFRIEMDDFGIGYSSLNMISNLPIDALKLDIQFIRNAFREGGNTHMLEVIIGIADYLSVPVIAEGVETQDQLHALKALGCDLVQGYFFSRPVPASEFEAFILQKKEMDAAAGKKNQIPVLDEKNARLKFSKIEMLMDETSQPEEKDSVTPDSTGEKGRGAIQLRSLSVFSVILAFVLALGLLFTDLAVARGYERMETASDRHLEAQISAADMESASDYLTDRVRCFVVTGEAVYLREFIDEIKVTRTRDKAVENLETLLGGSDMTALNSLNTALGLSNELVGIENLAIRLMVEAGEYDPSEIPPEIYKISLSSADKALSAQEQQAKARSLVFDSTYMHYKDRIRESVGLCTQSLIRTSSQELEEASARLSVLVRLQTVMTILFLLIVLVIVILITQMVRKPLTRMVKKMQQQETITPSGVEELRFVTRIYNRILEENRQAREELSHEASHDALTGLFNRGAYDLLIESVDAEHIALLLIDVDRFKEVNDTYGHAVGDRVLKRVAQVLKQSFRSVDILCRIGGDEFAVVMTRVNSSLNQLVINKIERANDLLMHPQDDLPPVSISVGVAFSDRNNPQGDIFIDADTALYSVKNGERKVCAVYGME